MVGNRGQMKAVKEHLLAGNTLTDKQAVDMFGAYRLSSIIHLLRKSGMNISCTMKEGVTRYGDSTRFGVYKLEDIG